MSLVHSSPTKHRFDSLSRSDFWFVDGNVVIITETLAFKVHRGQLSRHSEVFNGLFQLPQPPTTDIFDGCPYVELQDCPSDVLYFLEALYDGLYLQYSQVADFPMIAGVLRLSTKYLVEHLRNICLQRLERDWPSTLVSWDRREHECTDSTGRYRPREVYPHPILLIGIAIELDIPSLLPAAFYDLSRYGPSRIAMGTPGLASTSTSESESNIQTLSTDLLCRILRGRESAQHFMMNFVMDQVQHRKPSLECLFKSDKRPSRLCCESFYFLALNILRTIGGIACGRDADPLFTVIQAMEMLSRTDFTDGDRKCGLQLCQSCKVDFANSCVIARQDLWQHLPAWFELQDASEERNICFE